MGFDFEFFVKFSRVKDNGEKPAEAHEISKQEPTETHGTSNKVTSSNSSKEGDICSGSFKKGFFAKLGEKLGSLVGSTLFLWAASGVALLWYLIRNWFNVA